MNVFWQKDGFLTPATPEPHKFPFVNEDSSHNPGVLSENDVHFLDKQNKGILTVYLTFHTSERNLYKLKWHSTYKRG